MKDGNNLFDDHEIKWLTNIFNNIYGNKWKNSRQYQRLYLTLKQPVLLNVVVIII